jgi:hypothetical protein
MGHSKAQATGCLAGAEALNGPICVNGERAEQVVPAHFAGEVGLAENDELVRREVEIHVERAIRCALDRDRTRRSVEEAHHIPGLVRARVDGDTVGTPRI